MGGTVEPEVFLIGETRVNEEGLTGFLQHIGAPNWKSDAPSDLELLCEVYGRACYRSFGTGLNPNITRVRTSNESYISNIIAKGDGSVLEHGFVNFFIANVSRVFTHELVRHRVGVAISQESLRFVRLTDLDWYAPTCIQESEEAMTIFTRTMEELGKLQMELSDLFGMDQVKTFDEKKEVTSAIRRLAPMGLATNIGWSTNIRTLRHVIEQRTAPWADLQLANLLAEPGDKGFTGLLTFVLVPTEDAGRSLQQSLLPGLNLAGMDLVPLAPGGLHPPVTFL